MTLLAAQKIIAAAATNMVLLCLFELSAQVCRAQAQIHSR
jgi:hypothetical protein